MRTLARFMLITTTFAAFTACVAQTERTDDSPRSRGAGTVPASRLLPAEPREATFVWTDGPNEGQEIPYRFEPSDDGGYLATLEGRHVARLKRDDGGGWRLAGEDDLSEKVTIDYDPPLPRLPDELETGAIYAAESDMTVRHLETGAPRDRGTCAVEIELLGVESMRLDDRTVDTLVIRTTRRIDLNLANVTVTMTTHFQPRVGVVAEHVRRRVKSLGLFERTVEHRRVVIEP